MLRQTFASLVEKIFAVLAQISFSLLRSNWKNNIELALSVTRLDCLHTETAVALLDCESDIWKDLTNICITLSAVVGIVQT